MKKFSEIKIGDEFYSEFAISRAELDNYISFSGIKNINFDKQFSNQERKMISGRAILSKIEGEFTRLGEIYGNQLIFYGIDGDPSWNNRQTRFLKPILTDEKLRIRFKISESREINDEFGLLGIDFEASNENGEIVLISKRNLYQIKKEPSVNQ